MRATKHRIALAELLRELRLVKGDLSIGKTGQRLVFVIGRFWMLLGRLMDMPLLDLNLLAKDFLKVADDMLTSIFNHYVLSFPT